jgi:nicotinamidase-related amidase
MSSIQNTAIVLIDPYNDFLHPEGKLYSALAASLQEADTIRHINELLTAARAHKIPVYYGLHQQYKPGFFDGWKHMKTLQQSQKDNKVFEEGSWGAQIFKGMEPMLENNDVVVSKHWSSRIDRLSPGNAVAYVDSSFQNTDLDYVLRQREITHVVIAGLVTNSCVESTARYAYDLLVISPNL